MHPVTLMSQGVTRFLQRTSFFLSGKSVLHPLLPDVEAIAFSGRVSCFVLMSYLQKATPESGKLI